jgi:aminopeptidase N
MLTRAAAVTVVLICTVALVLPAQRLPPTAVPEHYDIHLAPNFESDTFDGSVSISIRLNQSVRSVTVNAAEIQFLETTITAGRTTQSASVSLDPEKETARLTVPNALPAGPATIRVRYSGVLNDKLRGFYLSRANNRDYAITQLEATDARRAFPSFDEPAMKATFALSVTIDVGDTAISNGRVLSDTPGPGGGKHTLKFSTTKRMSPYLVAMLVGDWECIAGSADRIPIRICSTPDRKGQLAFALEAAEFALHYFNRYFAIDYPFEKLDIVAVPDFSAGAMENTAAIVFREQYLLVRKEGDSIEHQKQVSQFLAHEIAHQWFGDLVTMQWWDDIWLNEGFATWMERRPMDEWKPEWNARIDEVHDTQDAMNLDALRATRPIRIRVETPDEINQVFDAIAYQKTAAVIRMVEGYVGAANYRNGINAYVKRFAFANATGEGFWTTLASTTKRPVDRILSSYITQSSMPLLAVDSRCSGGSTQLSLSQKPISSAVPASTTWEIPVCYKRGHRGTVERHACAVLQGRASSITLDGCSSWVFANVDGRGYYRTSYSSPGLQALHEAIRNDQLSPVEQMSLTEDIWALVRLNEQSIADFLSLAAAVSARLNAAMPADRISFISDRLIEEGQRPLFEQWIRQTWQPILTQVGWEPLPKESPDRQQIRSAVLHILGYAGRDPEVLAEARRRAERYLAGGTPVDPNLADTIVRLAAIDGDSSLYGRYVAQMNSRDQADQTRFRDSLAYFSDPNLSRRTLEYTTSGEVRTQDAPDIIAALMARPWAAASTWEHVKRSWNTLERVLGVFQGLPIVIGSTQHFCDMASRNDVERFLTEHPIRGTNRVAQRALETIDRCIATREQQSRNLGEFLRQATSAGN